MAGFGGGFAVSAARYSVSRPDSRGAAEVLGAGKRECAPSAWGCAYREVTRSVSCSRFQWQSLGRCWVSLRVPACLQLWGGLLSTLCSLSNFSKTLLTVCLERRKESFTVFPGLLIPGQTCLFCLFQCFHLTGPAESCDSACPPHPSPPPHSALLGRNNSRRLPNTFLYFIFTKALPSREFYLGTRKRERCLCLTGLSPGILKRGHVSKSTLPGLKLEVKLLLL